MQINHLKIIPTSLVTRNDLQKIVFQYHSSKAAHLYLTIYQECNTNNPVFENIEVNFTCGNGQSEIFLPVQSESFEAVWKFSDKAGNTLINVKALWKKPREWTIFAMISSHTDIGLHNSQYIQRYTSSAFIDQATELCDKTENDDINNQYRYTMEGTWFWNNYGMDRGKEAADEKVQKYIKTGKLGACAAIAGNHIHTYGLEEMCRSTYERKILEEDWDVRTQTLTMIDNNGLPMSMIQPYAEAGYKNLIFAPNHWNPINSTVWRLDRSVPGYVWNPNAGVAGARIDVRYDSELPMIFNWEDESGNAITVWSSTQYEWGGQAFGFFPFADRAREMPKPYDLMWETLEKLEMKYNFDTWLFLSYGDDQKPSYDLCYQIKDWNSKWKWPKVRTLGDPNEPFNRIREKFPNDIPTLKGDITGGWYQHPLSIPELMSQKYEADIALPMAETWSSIASLVNKDYGYPKTAFRRAWYGLLYNDEHSYGVSGYQGRRVYETWMQHRDWINKAKKTAQDECERALKDIASNIPASEESVVMFNSTNQERTELMDIEGKSALVSIAPIGYGVVSSKDFKSTASEYQIADIPLVIENDFYRINFKENGAIGSIYDNNQARELIDPKSEFGCNEIVYTKDNHQSFSTPQAAKLRIKREAHRICVEIKTEHTELGAELLQTVTLYNFEKKIEFDNQLFHVKDMINKRRYNRFLYVAFPFLVEGGRRYCHLNGAMAEYAKDITGHGTDVYMAAREFCCVENDDFGVALLMRGSQIVEFDHIHIDKTDFGNAGDGSNIFAYVANDWLQMHTPGGSHLDYHLRFAIVSYEGTYQNAKIPAVAERFTTPLKTVCISKQSGSLPQKRHSFLNIDGDARLLCIKCADDGKGIIARLYGNNSRPIFDECERTTVDERPIENTSENSGFVTYRLGKNSISVKTVEPKVQTGKNGAPAPIGENYTGLIARPCAAAGENQGHLYLLWGANTEPDLSHYKLYRSEVSGFIPDEQSFVADIMPEQYVDGRYVDEGLKVHTAYYYRVCAVNKDGVCGEMSEEFCGITREEI